MAGKQHDFLVSFISGKLQKQNFKVICFEGKFVDCLISPKAIPPRIINHRPDIIAEKEDGTFCIGEAKTKNDLHSQRTKNQFIDFANFVSINKDNRFIIGIPIEALEILRNVLKNIGIIDNPQLVIYSVPTLLMTDIEDDE